MDLARRHGLTAQAVRNYEERGVIPPADRTPTGYRVYRWEHVLALEAFLALAAAHGHATATAVMRSAVAGDVGSALRALDESREQLARDRATLDDVAAGAPALAVAPPADRRRPPVVGIGPLARRLGVTAATVRDWEAAGLLAPGRDPVTGHRRYGPADVRDADLVHLLRRGGLGLARIAVVVREVRTAGSSAELVASLAQRRAVLTDRGLAMLRAAGLLAAFLDGQAPR